MSETSMIWTARLADAATLANLTKNTGAIGDFIVGLDCDEADLDAPADVHNPKLPFDLDTQWQAIHFLLTGSAGATDSPLSVIVGKFAKLGKDLGFGPAWVIPAEAIAAADEALKAVKQTELSKRYDPKAMVAAQVYEAKALAEDGPGGVEFVMDDVARLRSFLSEGAKRKMAALAVIA